MDKPDSAYYIWLKSVGKMEVCLENPGKPIAQIAKLAENKWKSFDNKTRAHWERKEKEAWEHYKSSKDRVGKHFLSQMAENPSASTVMPPKKLDENEQDKHDSNETKSKKIKLSLDESAIFIKKQCALKEKKTTRTVSKEAHDSSNKKATISPYSYRGGKSLCTFGGLHNKCGTKAGNSLTIPTDVLPIAGTTKDILMNKVQNSNLNDAALLLKVHPDKCFGLNKDKMNVGTRLLKSIDESMIDQKGFPKNLNKGTKAKKAAENPLKYATETEIFCIASSTIGRLLSGSDEHRGKLEDLLSTMAGSSEYAQMEHGVDRAVMQAITAHSSRSNTDAPAQKVDEVPEVKLNAKNKNYVEKKISKPKTVAPKNPDISIQQTKKDI